MSGDAAQGLPAPPATLVADDENWLSWSVPVWRVHANEPGRPAWNELRHWGPAPGTRFDPQEPPSAAGQPEGVQYVGASALIALTEAFQSTRAIPVHDDSLWLFGWEPARPMRLLDVRYTFGAANGTNAAFSTADKSVVRQWARAAHLRWTDMDGIVYNSKVVGGSSIALFSHAAVEPVWPANPTYARALSDPAARPLLQKVADRVRWGLDYGG